MIGALVLAGGNARRLGGISKGDVAIGGVTMLQSVTDACQQAGVDKDNIIVVGHAETDLKKTVEDPPRSGPAAGIGAGLPHITGEQMFILSCDIPFIARGLPELIANFGGDGVCFGGERAQYLAGLYDSRAIRDQVARLESDGGLTGLPVRAIMKPLNIRILEQNDSARDLDTWDEIASATQKGLD